MSKGLFISLEGIDGSGKTTLIQHLNRVLEGYPLVNIREPGGTAISEKIREILLNVDNHQITPRTEAFLYAAARSQVVEQLIRPSLEQGKIVLADRYLDSTIAYQGYGRGVDSGVSPYFKLFVYRRYSAGCYHFTRFRAGIRRSPASRQSRPPGKRRP